MRLHLPPERLVANLRKQDYLLVLAFAGLLLAIGSYQMVPGVCGTYHDDAIYVITAKALAEGHGYRLINLPGAPLQTKYPILYPALLALVWKLWPSFPDNLLLMQSLNLLLGAATVALAYLYMVRFGYFSRGVAAAAVLLTVTSTHFLYFCGLTLSEIPFALTFIIAAWTLDRHLETPPSGRASHFLLGLILALPFSVRSIGIVLPLAGLAILYVFRKSSWWTAFGVATVVGPLLCWMLLVPAWQDLSTNSYYTNYLTWWSAAGFAEMPRVFFSNLAYLLHNTAAIGLGLFRITAIPAFVVWTLYLLAGVTLYSGLMMQLPSARVLPYFLAGYVLLTLIWPWPPSRFVVPVLPFLLAYLLGLVARLLQRPASVRWPGRLAILALFTLLAARLALVGEAASASRTARYPTREVSPVRVSWTSYEEVFDWIRAHSRQGDTVAAGFDTMISLYTGRPAFRPYVGRSTSLFYGGDEPPLGTMWEMIGTLGRYKARYLVVTPLPMFSEDVPFSRLLDQLQSDYPRWLKPVYRGEDERFVIFEVVRDAAPDAGRVR